ncbi:hypothetical protein PY479_10430 [Shewanella sp. A32]|uniref:hypothetical protein n=1 Tax=Shewanella sp. A32 TaxID=3031327 RepID=UPI0023B8D8A4|nr:hypothetical protein [Shewanella sp. A32]MDF0534687.1 hypothetical protein [Shewanella sp. A32]
MEKTVIELNGEILSQLRTRVKEIFKTQQQFDISKVSMLDNLYPELYQANRDVLMLWQVIERLSSDYTIHDLQLSEPYTFFYKGDGEEWKVTVTNNQIVLHNEKRGGSLTLSSYAEFSYWYDL